MLLPALDDYVESLVDDAPPLSPEQVDRLVTLLRPAPHGQEAA